MNTYYIVCRQTNDVIEQVSTIEEGRATIEAYESEDRRDGVYSADFYDITDAGKHSVEW